MVLMIIFQYYQSCGLDTCIDKESIAGESFCSWEVIYEFSLMQPVHRALRASLHRGHRILGLYFKILPALHYLRGMKDPAKTKQAGERSSVLRRSATCVSLINSQEGLILVKNQRETEISI